MTPSHFRGSFNKKNLTTLVNAKFAGQYFFRQGYSTNFILRASLKTVQKKPRFAEESLFNEAGFLPSAKKIKIIEDWSFFRAMNQSNLFIKEITCDFKIEFL